MQVDQKERVGLCKNREKVEEYKEIDKFYTKKRIHSLDIFQRVVCVVVAKRRFRNV